jgi:hypothetical protein
MVLVVVAAAFRWAAVHHKPATPALCSLGLVIPQAVLLDRFLSALVREPVELAVT